MGNLHRNHIMIISDEEKISITVAFKVRPVKKEK
jgi:hypothetical protein